MVGLEGVEGRVGLVVGWECEVGGRWHGVWCGRLEGVCERVFLILD